MCGSRTRREYNQVSITGARLNQRGNKDRQSGINREMNRAHWELIARICWGNRYELTRQFLISESKYHSARFNDVFNYALIHAIFNFNRSEERINKHFVLKINKNSLSSLFLITRHIFRTILLILNF